MKTIAQFGNHINNPFNGVSTPEPIIKPKKRPKQKVVDPVLPNQPQAPWIGAHIFPELLIALIITGTFFAWAKMTGM